MFLNAQETPGLPVTLIRKIRLAGADAGESFRFQDGNCIADLFALDRPAR